MSARAVSDADFDALKKTVEQMNEKLQSLEATHNQDETQILNLKRQLGEAQTVATNAQETAEAANSKAASLTPPRDPTHNFTMVGDAEAQFGRPGRTALLPWLILRRFSCFAPATMSCSRPVSTSRCKTTSARTACPMAAVRPP